MKNITIYVCLLVSSFVFAPLRLMAQGENVDSVANEVGGLATDVFASLLIAEPSNDIYGCCGHCAIRMRCPSHDMDYCFTYSLDNTLANKFRFFNGTGEGSFVPVCTDEYLEEYRENHRRVMEYRLNLTLEEKRVLWQSLDENVNSSYRWKYDYLETNCSAMCAYMIEKSLTGEKIEYGRLDPVLMGDNRTFLREVFSKTPWYQFFWLTILGDVGEAEGEIYTRLAPLVIKEVWGYARLVNDSTGEARPVFDGEPLPVVNDHTELTTSPINPFMAFLSLLVVSLIFTLMTLKGVARKACLCFDVTLLALQSMAGIVFLYFNTLSQWQCVQSSWHVLVMNPLPLLVVMLFRKKPKYMRMGMVLYGALIVAYLCVAPFSPQIQMTHVFIALALLLRLMFIIKLTSRRVDK